MSVKSEKVFEVEAEKVKSEVKHETDVSESVETSVSNRELEGLQLWNYWKVTKEKKQGQRSVPRSSKRQSFLDATILLNMISKDEKEHENYEKSDKKQASMKDKETDEPDKKPRQKSKDKQSDMRTNMKPYKKRYCLYPSNERTPDMLPNSDIFLISNLASKTVLKVILSKPSLSKPVTNNTVMQNADFIVENMEGHVDNVIQATDNMEQMDAEQIQGDQDTPTDLDAPVRYMDNVIQGTDNTEQMDTEQSHGYHDMTTDMAAPVSYMEESQDILMVRETSQEDFEKEKAQVFPQPE